jgi:hypothetical protein
MIILKIIGTQQLRAFPNAVTFIQQWQFGRNTGGSINGGTSIGHIPIGQTDDTPMTSALITCTPVGSNVDILVQGPAATAMDWTGIVEVIFA